MALNSVTSRRKISVLACKCFDKSQNKTLKETSRNIYVFTLYSDQPKIISFQKNQRINEVLEQIKGCYTNRGGHSDVYRTLVSFWRVRNIGKMLKSKSRRFYIYFIKYN